MIGLIDMQMGNLRSVSNAVDSLGFDVEVISDPTQLAQITHAIIPGVGSYTRAMEKLHALKMVDALKAFADSGRPLMGVCLGMQLLSDSGEEGGQTRGLGLVRGKVVKMNGTPEHRIPHVGWNTLSFKVPHHPVFDKIKSGVDFYFVHSYNFCCGDAADLYASTGYIGEIASIVGRANVIGFQFHPEKSQVNGLRLLENFCNWNGQC